MTARKKQASEEPEQWLVDSFIGEHGGGNRHLVRVYREDWPYRPRTSEDTLLVELRLASNSTQIAARFSKGGRIIQRCGSGNVAAAYVLLQELNLSDVTLQTACERLQLVKQQQKFGYVAWSQSIRLTTSTALPGLIGGLQEKETALPKDSPIEIYAAGGSKDYLIARFAHPGQVAQLQPDFAALGRGCPAAIIATAEGVDAACDYVLRYFAPRYGVTEDSATGSANTVLAHFWAYQLGKTSLRSRQLSPSGGEFWVSVLDSHPPRSLIEPTQIRVLGRAFHH